MEQLMGEKEKQNKKQQKHATNVTTQEWTKKTPRYLWNTRLGAPNRFTDNIYFNKT